MQYRIIKSKEFTANGRKHQLHIVAVKGRAMCLNSLKWEGEQMPKVSKGSVTLPKGSVDVEKRITEAGTYYDILPKLGDTL